jgi:hypothetical protein
MRTYDRPVSTSKQLLLTAKAAAWQAMFAVGAMVLFILVKLEKTAIIISRKNHGKTSSVFQRQQTI